MLHGCYQFLPRSLPRRTNRSESWSARDFVRSPGIPTISSTNIPTERGSGEEQEGVSSSLPPPTATTTITSSVLPVRDDPSKQMSRTVLVPIDNEAHRWLLPPEVSQRIAITGENYETLRILLEPLALVQERLQEAWLVDDSTIVDGSKDVRTCNIGHQFSDLDFAGMVNPTLESIRAVLVQRQCTPQAQLAIQEEIFRQVSALYVEYLRFIRDRCGSEWEKVLDRTKFCQKRHQKHSEEGQKGFLFLLPFNRLEMAERNMVQRFRKAAEHSIPLLARPGAIYHGKIDCDYETMVAGLEKDLDDIAQIRRDTDPPIDGAGEGDEEDTGSLSQFLNGKVPRWAQRLCAKALVVGVNYLQGWLAWQGVKRAALQRERVMPKFPLF